MKTNHRGRLTNFSQGPQAGSSPPARQVWTVAKVVGRFALVAIISTAFAVPGALAATFTVNAADDVNDASCDGVHCSLREAILAANGAAGPDDIEFDIAGGGVQTIAVTGSALPAVTEALTIDGYSQPGASANTLAVGSDAVILIELDGSALGGGAGLTLSASGCTVRGLAIGGFPGAGINNPAASTGQVIAGNFVGLAADGSTAAGNGGVGVRCIACSTALIGGTAPADRNVISANGVHGISFQTAAPDNTVQGNYIGTDASGTLDRGNTQRGIWITGGGATSNTIGGSVAGAGNVISGNGSEGVRVNGSSTVIAGNFIGTDATGSAALPNGLGVQLQTAQNTVGGLLAAARNVISGNNGRGILINSGASENLVAGNFIGTDVSGTVALPNGSGMLIISASDNTVGGTSSAARNVISGNNGTGIRIATGSDATSGNTVAGNFIGTDVSGTLPLGNGIHGISLASDGVTALSSNTVGGAAAGAANVIAANTEAAIATSGATSSSNAVVGNFIGTDLGAALALPNAIGIRLELGASLQVQSNRILNNGTGVFLEGAGSSFEAASDGNCLAFNGTGVDNTTGAGTSFVDNWWGSPDGPSGVGPGAGDSVSSDVLFAPFLAAPPTGCPSSTGQVIVSQDTIPDGPQDFAFTGDLGAFSLDDDTDPTLLASQSFFVPAGIYNVTASVVAGFTLTDLFCSDPSGISTGDLGTRTVSVDLLAGETVTCTFVSVEDGSITITKDVVPDSPQDFDYTGDLGGFSLDDDADPTLPTSETFMVAPGTYLVTELAVANLPLTDIECVDPSGDTLVDLDTATATIELGDGEAVACTFVSAAPVIAIPTLGTYGLLAMVGLLLVTAMRVLRRRST
ncbi:MAG: IPTL-CTERM sorting domain-containing protein [Acidobacteriota bacterium]